MLIKTLISLIALCCLPFWAATVFTASQYSESYGVGVVLGAGVNANGQPSQVLKNRLDKSVELYDGEDIKAIVVTGDNREQNYNEPKIMRRYLIDAGVDPNDIISDFAGRRTADSCWRLKNVFGADEVVLISQEFHLPRAAILCEGMGLEVGTAAAVNANSQQTMFNLIREVPATWSALFDLLRGYEAEVGSSGDEIDISTLKTEIQY